MPRKFSGPVYQRDRPWQIYDLEIIAALAAFTAASFWAGGRPGAFFATVQILSFAGFLTIFYGSFIEPRLIRIRRYSAGNGRRSVKVAFLSDIHVGPYKGEKWVSKLAARTNALKPDLILLGGDFLYKEASALPELAPLKSLAAPFGVYAILGNHDEWHSRREATAWFAASGIPLLSNTSVRISKDGISLAVAGADDDWYGETDLDATFRGVAPDDLAVVMLHNPDLAPHAAAKLKARPGKSFILSGHTHGGQIRLPFLGSVPKMPHHLGRKYDRGVFAFDGIPLIIGAGLGESGPRARLFCPPEIVLAALRY